MSIGTGAVLFVIGAILAFAVHVSVGWLSLNVVGYVLMLAGLVGLILTIWFWSNRRRTVVTRPVVDPRDRVVDEQRRVEYHPPESDY
jgi:uncharacterized membrane protein